MIRSSTITTVAGWDIVTTNLANAAFDWINLCASVSQPRKLPNFMPNAPTITMPMKQWLAVNRALGFAKGFIDGMAITELNPMRKSKAEQALVRIDEIESDGKPIERKSV